MATLEIFTFFLLFFFFLLISHIATSSANCGGSLACTAGGPLIRFPFWLSSQQHPRCGYPGFDLSCNYSQSRESTILALPFYGDNLVVVESINYRDQIVRINDPEKCLPKRYLDNELSLAGSVFSYVDDVESYTFLNCSSQAAQGYPTISCLSSDEDDYKVVGVPSSWLPASRSSSLSRCSVMSRASVPLLSLQIDWEILHSGVRLQWNVPNCRFCEIWDKACGFANANSLQLTCSTSSNYGLTQLEKFGVLIGVLGVSGLLFMIGLAFKMMKACVRLEPPIPELTNRISVAKQTTGLDTPTIESYPKTELGESLELPMSSDNTCPICLGEYQPKETLRTIPECNHYFHATCIDEWLRRNAMCPFCRKPATRG